MKPLTIPQPYKATGTAGYTVEDWIEKTPLEQAQAHLRVMRDVAKKWAGVHWRESMGVPATVPADAQTLLKLCDQALQAIEDGHGAALLLAMQATAQAAELNRWAAIDEALKPHRSAFSKNSKGGKEGGKSRFAEHHIDIINAWKKHEMIKTPERERIGKIMRRLGLSRPTVAEHLDRAGLKPKKRNK